MIRFCKACCKPTRHRVFVENMTGVTRVLAGLVTMGGTEVLLRKSKECQNCGRTTIHHTGF